MSRPTKIANNVLSSSVRSQRSFLSSSPIAYESIARDLEDDEAESGGNYEDNLGTAIGDENRASEYSLAGSYRRTSYVGSGPRPLFPSAQAPDRRRALNEQDREAALAEERSLLRDNHLIPPKHPRRESTSSGKHSGLLKLPAFVPRKGSQAEEESAIADGEEESSEVTALLGGSSEPYGGVDTPENINKKWEEAVASGKIKTTWQREAVVLARYSRSLILTFLLQYSLTVASIFTVGHIGKVELGAVSLASMTANITGYAIYQGLATSLDTLCAQAYGSGMLYCVLYRKHAHNRLAGRKTLVGLQLQRMVYFLWVITVPIAIVWAFGTQILEVIVPEKETAALAGQYLKVLIIGAPGYAAFEAGKRFVQAQGMFSATLVILLICAPLNAVLHYVFVWVRQILSQFSSGILIVSVASRLGLHWRAHCCGHH